MENGNEQSLPHPDSDPVIPEQPVEQPILKEEVAVNCGGCGTAYTFDIEPRTASFTFDCRQCGTRNRWERLDS